MVTSIINCVPFQILCSFFRWEDETLGQTELLDTAEILDELVKEGYLSLTDMDLSTSHTAHSNRYGAYENLLLLNKLLLKQVSFTELKSSVTQSRQQQQQQQSSRMLQSSRMSQRSALPEEERRELRIWMRRKQRERLAAYQKHRESLREKERKPFTPSGKVVRCDVVYVFYSIFHSTLFVHRL